MNSGLGARIRFWGGYWLPSVFGSALGFIRRRKPVAAPAVLGVLLPEHMGDVVMTGPLLRSLRRRYPHARIMVAVPARLVGLLRGCPHVSDVLEWLPGRVAAMDLARRLRLAGCDLVVVPRSDPDRAWAPLVAARCGAPERVTLTAAVTVWARLRRLQGWPFFNVPILPPHGVRHEVMRRLSLSTYWSGDPADSALESWATSADRETVAPWMAGLPAGRLPVAFGLGASQTFRCWPAERFAALIDQLDTLRPIAPVLVVGPGEKALALAVAGRVRTRIHFLPSLDLGGTAAILERCAIFLGNDSGPAHLAAAAGIPVVMISAHALGVPETHPGNPDKCRPFGRLVRVVRPPSPAGGGMSGVTVEVVVAAALELGFSPSPEAIG